MCVTAGIGAKIQH